MKARELANYLLELEKTTSRLEITRILAEIFEKAEAEETDKLCYLLWESWRLPSGNRI